MAVGIILSVPVGETAPESINLSRAHGDHRDDRAANPARFSSSRSTSSSLERAQANRRRRSYRVLSLGDRQSSRQSFFPGPPHLRRRIAKNRANKRFHVTVGARAHQDPRIFPLVPSPPPLLVPSVLLSLSCSPPLSPFPRRFFHSLSRSLLSEVEDRVLERYGQDVPPGDRFVSPACLAGFAARVSIPDRPAICIGRPTGSAAVGKKKRRGC